MTSAHRLSNAGFAIPPNGNGANGGAAKSNVGGAVNATCPDCRSIFRVDLAKVPPGGILARCSVCGGVIPVSPPDWVPADPGPPISPGIGRFEPEHAAAFDWFATAESIAESIRRDEAEFARLTAALENPHAEQTFEPLSSILPEAHEEFRELPEPFPEMWAEPAPAPAPAPAPEPEPEPPKAHGGRVLYLEEVEVKSSRAKGLSCKVTLRRGAEVFVGESDGFESDKSRVELSARAAFLAIALCDRGESQLALEGAKIITAFERRLVLVGLTARQGRNSILLTGRCEIKESLETASAMAVLNATNRWMERISRYGAEGRRTRRLTPLV